MARHRLRLSSTCRAKLVPRRPKKLALNTYYGKKLKYILLLTFKKLLFFSDIKDQTAGTLSQRITDQLSGLKGLDVQLSDIRRYLTEVAAERMPLNNAIIFLLQVRALFFTLEIASGL